MKPELQSKLLLGITRSKAKMIEFAVPPEHRIAPKRNPAELFPLTVGIIGDLAAQVAREGVSAQLLSALKQELRFTACFFDAFLNGTPDSTDEPHLTLGADEQPSRKCVLLKGDNYSGNFMNNLLEVFHRFLDSP